MKQGDRFKQELRKAREAMKGAAPGGAETSGPFPGEEAVLWNLKHVFLAIAGAGIETFGDRIKDEQELLMALADVAASIFAIESVVARAAKIEPSLSPARKENVHAAVKVFTLQAVETVATAARKAAFIVGGESRPDGLLQGIRNLAEYDATGLVQAKRKLADAALDAERYIF